MEDTDLSSHTRGADGTRRTPSQALEHFRRTGQTEHAEILASLLERPRPHSRADRRRELFAPDVVDFLEQQDRRRDAARRLSPLCPFSEHETHTLGCHDPLAAAG